MSVNPSMGPLVIYPHFSKAISVASGSASTTASTLVAGVAGWTIYVTRVHVIPNQVGNTNFILKDSTGSIIFRHPFDSTVDPHDADYGDNGVPCTEGYNLQYVFSAAGTAFDAKILVDGYLRQTSPVSAAAYAAAALP